MKKKKISINLNIALLGIVLTEGRTTAERTLSPPTPTERPAAIDMVKGMDTRLIYYIYRDRLVSYF